MIEYNYIENLDIMGVNTLGNEDWEVIGATITKTPPAYIPMFDVLVKRGRQGHEMIEVDSNTSFIIDKSFSYGDSVILIFLTIFLFAMIGRATYHILFGND